MSNDGPVRIDYTISIGFPSAKHRGTMTIDRYEWNGLTPGEREKYIDEMYQQEVENVMDGGWNLVNADLDDPIKED